MSDDRNGDGGERSLLGRIAQAFSSEPRSREDLQDVLRLAMENDVIDEDAFSIIGSDIVFLQAQLQRSIQMLQDFKDGKLNMTPAVNEELWKAQKIKQVRQRDAFMMDEVLSLFP